MPTVLPFHRAVVRDPAFTAEPFSVHTRWIETEFDERDRAVVRRSRPGQGPSPPPRERITVEVGGKRLEVVLPGRAARWPGRRPRAAAAGRRRRRGGAGGRPAGPRRQASGDELVSPMQGTITKIVAAEGDQVAAG